MNKIGVLLLGYGTPSSIKPEDVRLYLTHILNHYRNAIPLDDEVKNLCEKYKKIGGPNLHRFMANIRDRLQKVLDQDFPNIYSVVYAMKHSSPWIREGLERLIQYGVEKIIAIPMAPFQSSMSTGSYRMEVENIRQNFVTQSIPPIFWGNSWASCSHFLDMWTELLQEFIRLNPSLNPYPDRKTHLIFVNHSLPIPVVERGEPYVDEYSHVAQIVAKKLGYTSFTLAYIGAGGGRMPWLKPSVVDVLSKITGQDTKTVLVVPIGFVSEHLEVLYDLDIVAREYAESKGIRWFRSPLPEHSENLAIFLSHIVLSEKSHNHSSKNSGW